MRPEKRAALAAIDEKAALFTRVSDRIWDLAELSLVERESCALYVQVARELGFDVEAPFGGIETAFAASFGQGGPHIGILAEYDALSGLSQAGGSAAREARPGADNGHGCGHNLLGAGALAAAWGIKEYLAATGKPGTVTLYGCPGEEGGASKAFMARDGLWRALDAALTWHPSDVNEVVTGTSISCIQKEYRFEGVSSHAAGSPELGRSALDAVELMNIGVQYLREHMPSTARVHYAITDGGGLSPNLVQGHASVLYMVRDVQVRDALALQARVDKIARAAAMMTETRVSERFIDGLANTMPNSALERLLYDNFAALGTPEHTDAERAFAKSLIETYENPDANLPSFAARHDERIAAEVAGLSQGGKAPLNDFLVPYFSSLQAHMGSTDVGDVSWQTPTAQVHSVTYPSRSPGHSWQNVSCARTSIGHKGLLSAGKVLAAAAIDLIDSPDLLSRARAEFEARTADGYRCPIPAEAVPTIVAQ